MGKGMNWGGGEDARVAGEGVGFWRVIGGGRSRLGACLRASTPHLASPPEGGGVELGRGMNLGGRGGEEDAGWREKVWGFGG